jgi:hypothetical protein
MYQTWNMEYVWMEFNGGNEKRSARIHNANRITMVKAQSEERRIIRYNTVPAHESVKRDLPAHCVAMKL